MKQSGAISDENMKLCKAINLFIEGNWVHGSTATIENLMNTARGAERLKVLKNLEYLLYDDEEEILDKLKFLLK